MTCQHDTIITWRDEAANPVMWSCMDCGNKFVPLAQQMIDDEALLRQCLREFQSFEEGTVGMFDGEFKEIITAIKERLK